MPAFVQKLASRHAAPMLHRNWLAAWWGARGAVKTGVSLADYLRVRAALYLRTLAGLGLRLPVEVALEGSELRLQDIVPPGTTGSGARPATTHAAGDAWERALAERHGPTPIAELADARSKMTRLDGQIDSAKAEVAARRKDWAEGLSSGKASAAGDREAAATQRPAVPSPAWAYASLAAAMLFIVTEAWQLALPFLNGAGVDVSELGAELGRSPASVLLGTVFAVGCTAMLVAFAHVALVRGQRAIYEETAGRRRAVDAIIATTTGLLAILIAWLLGALRQATMEAGLSLASAGGPVGSLPTLAFVLVTAGLPFFTAFLWHAAHDSLERRSGAAAAAHAFDKALRAKEEERERLEEKIRMANLALFELEVERCGSERDVHRLTSLGEEATREVAEEHWLAGEALVRAREELRAVLEVDRYEYLKAQGRAQRREAAKAAKAAKAAEAAERRSAESAEQRGAVPQLAPVETQRGSREAA